MDLQELADELSDIGDGEPLDNSELMLPAKVGQMASLESVIDEAGDAPDDWKEAREDVFAGIVIAAFEYAAAHDLDAALAIEERVEFMREQAEQVADVQDAIDDGDAQELVDAVSEDDESDDDNPRGFM